MTATQWSAEKALSVANTLKQILSPTCQRIEVAGSLRREKSLVGDIELVIVPKIVATPAAGQLFDTGDHQPLFTLLDDLAMCRTSNFSRGRCWGNKLRVLSYAYGNESINIDLFIVTETTWGNQLALRTGPADFSRLLVTHGPQGGAMPVGFVHKEGAVVREHTGTRMEFREERAFFNFLDLPYWKPIHRTEATLRSYLTRCA